MRLAFNAGTEQKQIAMKGKAFSVIFLFFLQSVYGQRNALESLLADSSMAGASTSICIINTSDNNTVFEYNSKQSLTPASIQKLITAAAALELLGCDHNFTTQAGYSGTIDKRTGVLTGNIILKGGGDPSLGSENFRDHYGKFTERWITALKNAGIKKVKGGVIADDSVYDYQPVPSLWIWEDIGNYYGAGVYGLSVFDNSFEIHFRTMGEGSVPVITRVMPAICKPELTNMLTASGTTDKGYVFSAPYNSYAWIAGTIPVNRPDFILRASMTDPPLVLARMVNLMLDSAGITTTAAPATARTLQHNTAGEFSVVDEVKSPPLKDIVRIMNHESVNLYAEHLVKELGRVRMNTGTNAAGIEVILKFLSGSGIDTNGIFLEDGSGLSPKNSITSKGMAELLSFMKIDPEKFSAFYNSLPEAGKAGTLKYYFRDPVFESNLRAKSGSMTRVRSYSGYFKTKSGKEMAFCIIVNNFSGSHQIIIKGIEEILKETIIRN